MNKKALVVTSSTIYFLGLNTLLNGLDYYDHTDIDVYVVYGNTMLPYLEYCKDKFSFPLYSVSIADYGDMDSRSVIRGVPEIPYGTFDENANACWAKYNFMLNVLSKQYEVICLIDADCMLLNNINQYFDEALKTGKIICPLNPRAGNAKIDFYSRYNNNKKELHAACHGHVVENFPVFYDPQKHNDVNQYVWDNRDKEVPNDPDVFNAALFELKKDNEIVYLSGDTWLGDFLTNIRYDEANFDGKFGITNYKQERMNVWHSRFWRRDANVSLIRYMEDNKQNKDIISHNVMLGEKAVRFFNNHKVTFNDIVTMCGGAYEYYAREWV